MKKKTAAEIFAEVSPETTVISGRRGRHGDKGRAKKLSEAQHPELGPYKPQPITEEEWGKSEGVKCPICGEKTLRLYPYGYVGGRKACRKCIDRRINLINNRRKILGARNRRR